MKKIFGAFAVCTVGMLATVAHAQEPLKLTTFWVASMEPEGKPSVVLPILYDTEAQCNQGGDNINKITAQTINTSYRYHCDPVVINTDRLRKIAK